MSRSRFVPPEVDVVPLALNGDTITLKRRLNHGEAVQARARMFPRNADGTIQRDPARYQEQLVLAYLVDWNLTDNGRAVPLRGLPDADRLSTLNALDDDDFLEIVAAVEAHTQRQAEAREAEKKTQAGASASPPT